MTFEIEANPSAEPIESGKVRVRVRTVKDAQTLEKKAIKHDSL